MPRLRCVQILVFIGWLMVDGLAQAQSLAQVLAQFRKTCDSQGQWLQSSSYVEETEELWGKYRARAILYAKRPLSMKRVIVRDSTEYVFCYDHNNNWKLDPTVSSQPVKMKKEEQLVGYRYFSSLDILFNDELMAQSQLSGPVEFQGINCHEIKTPEPDGGFIYTYIRVKNHYPLATRLVGPSGKDELVKVYQSYQLFNGVLIPVVAEYLANGKLIGRTRTVDFKLNETLAPAVFAPHLRNFAQQQH